MMSISIRQRMTVAAAVAACAFALPAMASASTATGCPASSPCEFVAGTGHDASTNTGGSTQFRVNTSPNVVFRCPDTRATVVTDGSAVVSTALEFNDCTAAGFPYRMTCTPSDLTIDSVSLPGDALGLLALSQNNCTIDIGPGLCTVRMSNTSGGQNIDVSVTGATGSGAAQLTAGISGNTDALTFNASGLGCSIAGVPSVGTWTLSNSPNSGNIVYDEVGSGLDIS